MLALCLIIGCIGRQYLKIPSSSQPVLIVAHMNMEMRLDAQVHLEYHGWQSGCSHREVLAKNIFLSLDGIYSGCDL